MKAIIYQTQTGLSYQEIENKRPKAGEVKIKLKSAGLNRRDLFVMNQQRSHETFYTPGSDGAGIITELGEGVMDFELYDAVIINPSLDWDTAKNVPMTPRILGGPSNGTFSEYIVIPSQNIIKKPVYLSWIEAGILSLSALTAYRALFTKGQLQTGQHLLIPGIGSGVATYALLFAKAIGAKVGVTSRDEEKLRKAGDLGADYLLKTNSDWKTAIKKGNFDIILDSIGPALFPKYIDVLKPDGNLVTFGASSGDSVNLSLRSLFYPQLNILGTSMGSKEEFEQMIQFITHHNIKPVLDSVYPLIKIEQALERMKSGNQFGNVGLEME
ncbi:zinc-binding dehydrogenase [Oceanobacillus timonensis]|uniref:zinc-binding dehydrogenase n=1 Tax=Oceanobacillus timonensis TaxID=1926285 RepID=UPI0009BB56C7|nr:zinc-binding dehydrogenase [Oceanobacillus timonensis]